LNNISPARAQARSAGITACRTYVTLKLEEDQNSA
jgi:hypothetical protein